MPRAPTSLSLSPGTLSQCRPDSVFESEMTREIGSEFEFPKTLDCQFGLLLCTRTRHTAMATTKLEARLLNLHILDTIRAAR
jgi:hypothetical protein